MLGGLDSGFGLGWVSSLGEVTRERQDGRFLVGEPLDSERRPVERVGDD